MAVKYDRIGDGYDLTRRADPRITERLMSLLDAAPGAPVLDVACGTGNYTFALELRRPTPGVRARIWTREFARHGVEAGSEDVLSLAREPAGGSATVFAGDGSQGWRARAGPCR